MQSHFNWVNYELFFKMHTFHRLIIVSGSGYFTEYRQLRVKSLYGTGRLKCDCKSTLLYGLKLVQKPSTSTFSSTLSLNGLEHWVYTTTRSYPAAILVPSSSSATPVLRCCNSGISRTGYHPRTAQWALWELDSFLILSCHRHLPDASTMLHYWKNSIVFLQHTTRGQC